MLNKEASYTQIRLSVCAEKENQYKVQKISQKFLLSSLSVSLNY